MKKNIILLSVLCSFTAPCLAQSQFSGWLASFNTIKTGTKTSIHSEIQIRSTDKIKQVQTVLLRAGLNVHLKKNLIVTGGYAYISNRRTVNNITGYAPEHRIWEQLLINHRLKTIALSHRFRLEQRFLTRSSVVNNDLKHHFSDYANRFRYFIRGMTPFKKQETFQKGLFGALQNEVFVNICNTEDVNGKFFDQNRIYLATGYRLSTKSDIEVGYLNQYTNGRTGSVTNHVIQLAAYMRL